MAKEITNNILLDHMQGMKHELQKNMKDMKHELRRDMKNMQTHLEQRMDRGFEEAKENRQALQEDLVATMEDTIRIRRHVGMSVASE